MNRVFIIGNLTADPDLRSTGQGTPVCSFTVAVNRRVRGSDSGQPEADYFRVTAWRALGENCKKYLQKGKKVAVIGPVSVSTYTASNGKTYANLDVTADDVEFLTPRSADAETAYAQAERSGIQHDSMRQTGGGFVQVDDAELPF